MIRVIIVDDHQVMIDGLKAILGKENDMQVVGEARDGEQLLVLLSRIDHQQLILILDIQMPRMSGVDATKVIRKKYPNVRILISSMHDKLSDIKSLIELGISGYIVKNTGREILLNAIRVISQGEEYFGAEVTKKIMNSLKSGSDSSATPTKRETEVLTLVAKGHSTAEIAEILCISTFTVDTHRKNILSKLNLKNTAGIVTYAIKNDLIDDKF